MLGTGSSGAPLEALRGVPGGDPAAVVFIAGKPVAAFQSFHDVPIVANLRHHDIEPVFNDETVHGEGPDFQWKRELTLLWDLATVMEAGRGKAAGNEDRIDFGFSVDWTHDTADGPGLVSISRRLRGSPMDKLVAEQTKYDAAAKTAGVLQGVFTDGDLRRALDDEDTDLHATPVSKLMGRTPKTIGADALAVEAAHLMEAHKISALVVVDADRRVVGALNIHDLLRARVV